jgi:hypothetical protein
MGLKMTLSADNNHMHFDFVDAYWAVEDIMYSTTDMTFYLYAYPSRDAKLAYLQPGVQQIVIDPETDGKLGGPPSDVYNPRLYCWQGASAISDIFPDGIPVDADAQKTAIYRFIKAYTLLPFEDVLEQ